MKLVAAEAVLTRRVAGARGRLLLGAHADGRQQDAPQGGRGRHAHAGEHAHVRAEHADRVPALGGDEVREPADDPERGDREPAAQGPVPQQRGAGQPRQRDPGQDVVRRLVAVDHDRAVGSDPRKPSTKGVPSTHGIASPARRAR
jgi:hypothetical protein